MGLVGIISSVLGRRSSAEPRAQIYLVPRKIDGSGDDTDIGVWALQYWPSSIRISQNPTYAKHGPTGSSHPLYQYVGCGERVMSFGAEFSRDLQGEIVDPSPVVSGGKVARDAYNVDVAQALVWLESLKMPEYGPDSDPAGWRPPPSVWVVAPNCKYGRARGGGKPTDVFQAVLTGFSSDTDAWFPDGTPRHAVAELTFEEIVQGEEGIVFANRKLMATADAGGRKYAVPVATRVDR